MTDTRASDFVRRNALAYAERVLATQSKDQDVRNRALLRQTRETLARAVACERTDPAGRPR